MSRLLRSNLLFILAIAAVAILARIIPHPANFAPVGAVALLGGMLLRKKYAVWTTLAVIVISDVIIGAHPLMLWTWGSFAVIAMLSSKFLSDREVGAGRLVTAALAGGTLFFVVTNFAVWLEGSLYSRTLEGFAQCFVGALPFYRNTILGDVFFVSIFYAVYLVTAKTVRHPDVASQASDAGVITLALRD